MAGRRFRTYFLRVNSRGHQFQDLLEHIRRLSLEERTIEVGESPVRLRVFLQDDQRPGVWAGDLERVQMGDFPMRSKLREDSRELDFEDDEGLGHQTAFVYDTANRVLAIQGNITGVGASRFKQYVNFLLFQRLRGVEVDFDVITLPPDEAARAYGPDAEFRKLTFSVTDPNAVAGTLANLEGARPIASTMLRTSLGDGQSVRMTVTLSVGHSRDHLNPGAVQRLLRVFQRAADRGVEVERLTASGHFDGENVELNFLPHKLYHDQTINIERRSVGFPARRGFINFAIHEKTPILSRMFRRRAAGV